MRIFALYSTNNAYNFDNLKESNSCDLKHISFKDFQTTIFIQYILFKIN